MRRHLLLLLASLSLTIGSVSAFSVGDFGAATQLPTVAANELPPEAHVTLTLIDAGGPFPHRQDSMTFGNREKLLKKKTRGYYREYTVATPGARTRGARRIVTGDQPPAVFYYTDDHYRSFRQIKR